MTLMNSRKLSIAAERAVILQFMDADTYWDLYRKYGHEVVYESFSKALAIIQKPTWRMRLLWRVRKWRSRAERLLSWLEAPDGNKA